jgi:PAS domain S-box-containing protein
MMFGEAGKYKAMLFEGLKRQFGSKLTDEELSSILKSVEQYISEMVKMMRQGKSAHEKFFSDIILKSLDAIIGFRNDCEIFIWNEGAEKIFGYRKEEVLGKDFEFLIPEHLKKKGEKEYIIERVKQVGFISDHKTQRITKSGEMKEVSISRFPIFDENHVCIGNVGIIRDITNEKKLERELRERENLALIGEVVSSIAHNLSNPLNIISGNADYLLLDKKENDEGYEELKVIIEETTRITKSIRQLLNFSKPVTLTRENIDINEIMKDILGKVEFMASGKEIIFKSNLSSALPEISADRELIRDVFLNLINNSIQALSSKGTITIKTSLSDKYIAAEISDTGAGIPKENLDKIFKPFFSTKGYGKGTGLGLSFAERVIREHQGKIEVSSKPGKGTMFKIFLPTHLTQFEK